MAIPQAWSRLVDLHQATLPDQMIMKNGMTKGQARDEAIRRYCQNVDEIMDCLNDLRRGGRISIITSMLAQNRVVA